jgi:hypothetical protein
MKLKNLVYVFLIASFAIATGAHAFQLAVTPDAGQTCSFQNNMLTCTGNSTPVCTLTPSVGAPTPTQGVNLTVGGCTGPYTFTTSAQSCPQAAGTTSPVALGAPNTGVGPCTYTVAASGATGGQTTLTWATAQTVTAPSNCTVSGGGAVNSGAQVTLTASCSGGSAPGAGGVGGWAWKVGSGTSLGQTGNPYIFTATSTGTYYVTASNSAGSSDSSSATVTVNSVVAPPPPNNPGSCPSGTYTVPNTPAILGQGNGSFMVYSTQNQVTVFPFSVQGMTRADYIKTTQNAGSMNVRMMVISATPCGAPVDSHATNIDGQASVIVVPSGSSYATMYSALRTDGTIYYANIYNIDANGAQTCQNNDCNFLITFNGS